MTALRWGSVARGVCRRFPGVASISDAPGLRSGPKGRHDAGDEAGACPERSDWQSPCSEWAGEGGQTDMKTHLSVRIGAFSALAMAAVILGPSSSQAQSGAPRYEADVSWPKPLPNKWVLGGLGGLCVDAQDHVLILNRQDVIEGDLNAGTLAPPMIEFDPAGNVVNSWGDSKLLDPRLHSCHFDKDGNVWVAAAPSGMIQKYTHDGKKLLLQIGKKG